MGPGGGPGGSGIPPASVICLNCLQKETAISGCLFEGPEIRKPEATRQRKRWKKAGLEERMRREKQGHKRGGLCGKQWSAWKMRPWNPLSNYAVLGNRSLGTGQEISAGKSGDLGAGAGPAINQLCEPLFAKVGELGHVIQRDFWL